MDVSLTELAQRYDTDKSASGSYIQNYESYFAPLRKQPVRLLELGVFRGGSLLCWKDYFEHGLIVGLDANSNPLQPLPDRVCFYQGLQDDVQLLNRLSAECAPDGWDIIIDDAAHIGTVARETFRCLFSQHLKAGGLYVIEDWGTGYWGKWPDGRTYPESTKKVQQTLIQRLASRFAGEKPRIDSTDFANHNFGMVGFIKELIDEVAWPDITHPVHSGSHMSQRPSTIRSIQLTLGQAFIRKT